MNKLAQEGGREAEPKERGEHLENYIVRRKKNKNAILLKNQQDEQSSTDKKQSNEQ